MRTLLAGVSALLVLTGCGTAQTAEPATASPEPPRAAGPDAEGDGHTAACTHPAGFRVSHPADWSVNPGEVLPVCSWFDRQEFQVPEASDAQLADIRFSVRPGDELPSPWPDETSRARLVVDGHDAVRLEQVTTPGFYPAGTPITTYVLDLAGGDALVATTVGLPDREYQDNVAVLDAMMASLVLDAASAA